MYYILYSYNKAGEKKIFQIVKSPKNFSIHLLKKIHIYISEPMQFKPMSFKGQLYILPKTNQLFALRLHTWH